MLRVASLEGQPERFKDWMTEEEKTQLRELSMFTDPETGARFWESLVGTSGTDTFQDLAGFLCSEIGKLKGPDRGYPDLSQPPYYYLGRMPAVYEMEIVVELLAKLYKSRYKEYWDKISPPLRERCSQLEKVLQEVSPADRLIRFSRLPPDRIPQNRTIQIFVLDRGGPAFGESSGSFIPLDPYRSEINAHGRAYIIAHELSHGLVLPEGWRQVPSIQEAVSGMPNPGRTLGALDEAVAHMMGVTVAQSIGNEHGGWGDPSLHARCGIHKDTGRALIRHWPRFLRGEIDDPISLCEITLSELQGLKAPQDWEIGTYEMAKPYSIKYDNEGNPIDIREETIAMTPKELPQILGQWQAMREEALEMMGKRERGLVKKRIRQSSINSIQVVSKTTDYLISLSNSTRPQLIIPEASLRSLVEAHMEDPVHMEWEQRLLKTIELNRGRITSAGGDVKPLGELATFLSIFLEITYAWRFYHDSTHRWRHIVHKTYHPDNLDRFEGTKEKRDQRHSPIKALVEGRRILDMGCGFGRIEEDLVRWGARSITALDISTNFLGMMDGYARDRGFSLDNVLRIQGDIRRLPFKKGSFDLVLSIGTLFQTPYPQKAIDEVSYLLGQGQKAFLEFQARNPGTTVTPRFHFGMRQYLSEKETTTLLRAADLEAREVHRLKDDTKVNYIHSHLVTHT